MGVRSATEETYLGESRGCYLAGVFDQFPGEVTELANLPDWVGTAITMNGESFTLATGKILAYRRSLNLKTGELLRQVEWESPRGDHVRLGFTRFVSLQNPHLAGVKIEITPQNNLLQIEISSGFNGQVTNSGVQHCIEGATRVFPKTHQYYLTVKTQESTIDVVLAAQHRFAMNGQMVNCDERFRVERRRLILSSTWSIPPQETLTFEKIVSVSTSRDPEFLPHKISSNEVVAAALDRLSKQADSGYAELFEQSKIAWQQKWDTMGIELDGPDCDQLAIRFAQFHLLQMTPAHDSRLSIGAKGLSGEGYKGHVFWDTEIFMLPFLTYTFPALARQLLEYRYHTLDGARQNAQAHGYQGAMYAWESAVTGIETTPKWWGIDLLSGTPIRVWGAEIKVHITADVVYALWQYVQATQDHEFMRRYGCELLFETANFWGSRVTYDPQRDCYELHDVMGPDEYGEHVNNNAYTNYFVQWHLRQAVEWTQWLKNTDETTWQRLNERLHIDQQQQIWHTLAEKMVTPINTITGIIPQDDGFLEKRVLDLTPYRGKINVIFDQLSWAEITTAQVVKQADVVMLLYLLGDAFSQPIKQVNWRFYEPKTLHDSSLSPAIHAILANDLGDAATAYRYFEQASRIDLGNDDPHRSDEGLHAAALGGLWQAVVNGFAGVRIRQGKLTITPRLPKTWNKLAFRLNWWGDTLAITIDHSQIAIRKETDHNARLEVEIAGQAHTLAGEELIINRRELS